MAVGFNLEEPLTSTNYPVIGTYSSQGWGDRDLWTSIGIDYVPVLCLSYFSLLSYVSNFSTVDADSGITTSPWFI
jgi:hypothetical protein